MVTSQSGTDLLAVRARPDRAKYDRARRQRDDERIELQVAAGKAIGEANQGRERKNENNGGEGRPARAIKQREKNVAEADDSRDGKVKAADDNGQRLTDGGDAKQARKQKQRQQAVQIGVAGNENVDDEEERDGQTERHSKPCRSMESLKRCNHPLSGLVRRGRHHFKKAGTSARLLGEKNERAQPMARP
jgi:hypothetical protein